MSSIRRSWLTAAIVLVATTAHADTPLERATLCAQRHQPLAAIEQLSLHLRDHPADAKSRLTLAELLWQAERWADAADQYAALLESLPESAATRPQRLHAHARIAEAAEHTSDAYARHLHRGLGLSLMAESADRAAAEPLWCQAAAELTDAQRLRPEAARPAWHLVGVWTALDQAAAARAALRRAARARGDDLAPRERTALALADRAGRAGR